MILIYKKGIFLFLCIVALSYNGYTQEDPGVNKKILLEKVSSYLEKCFTYQETLQVKKILTGKYSFLLDSIFLYIPNMNPLNPAKTDKLSSKFGYRLHPIKNKIKNHRGIDLAAKKGTYIYAPASGTVKTAKKSSEGYGKRVVLIHKYGFKTVYGHLSVILVRKGQKIKKGDIIGLVGSTGLSNAPHLHYEVIKNRKHIDPLATIDNEITKKEKSNNAQRRR